MWYTSPADQALEDRPAQSDPALLDALSRAHSVSPSVAAPSCLPLDLSVGAFTASETIDYTAFGLMFCASAWPSAHLERSPPGE